MSETELMLSLRRHLRGWKWSLFVLGAIVLAYFVNIQVAGPPAASLLFLVLLLVFIGSEITRLLPSKLWFSEVVFLSVLMGVGALTVVSLYQGFLRIPFSPTAVVIPPIGLGALLIAIRGLQALNKPGFKGTSIWSRPIPILELIAPIAVVLVAALVPLKEVLEIPLLIGWDPWVTAGTVSAIQSTPTPPSSIHVAVLGTGFFYFLGAVAGATGIESVTIVKFAGPASLAVLSLGLFSVVRRNFGVVAGIIASVLLVGNPWVIVRFTLGIRENFAIVFLAGLILLTIILIHELGNTRSFEYWKLVPFVVLGTLVYAVILSSSFVTHLITFIFVTGLTLAYVVRWNRSTASRNLVLYSLLVLLASFLVILPLSLPAWGTYVSAFFEIQGGIARPGYRAFTWETVLVDFSLVTLATVGLGLFIAIYRKKDKIGKLAPLLGFAGVTAVLLLFVPIYADRLAVFRLILYLILAVVPFAALGWYVVLRGLRRPWLRAVFLVALSLVSIIGGLQVQRWAPYNPGDLQTAVFLQELSELKAGVVVCPKEVDCELLRSQGVPNVLSMGGHQILSEVKDLSGVREVLDSEFGPKRFVLAFMIMKHVAVADANLMLIFTSEDPTYVLSNAKIWLFDLGTA